MRIPKIISILVIFGILLPSFSLAQNQPVQPPENFEEAKEIGKKTLEVSKKELPGILERIWKEKVLPVWKKIYNWFKENIWSKIEKRKSVIKEEFEKEKKELKEEVPKVTKSLWEKFKELIK
jgi:hypothetical protein